MTDGRRVWTDEELAFLREYAPGHSRREIYEELSRRFPSHTHTFENMVAAMKNRKITTGTHRWYGHALSPKERDPKWYRDEELAFLREYAPGHTRKEIHAEYNRRFPERPRSFKSVVACMKNHSITNGLDGRFQKGRKSEAWNKGKKMTPEHRAKCEHSFFGSKNKPPKTEPIGTEKKLSDGYIWVKVDDQLCAKKNVNWKQKQCLIWEQHNGPIPEGMFVTFLDGNRENFDLDNLALITRAEHARLNQSGLRSEDPEITQAALQLAKLTTKIGQRQRDNKESNQ